MTNLVILTYGSETEYKRGILAVLSYCAWASEAAETGQVLVFTDNAAYFRPFFTGLQVTFRELTPEDIRTYQGPAAFVHRLKVAVIDEVLRRYPEDNLLYLDADTFVFADPRPLVAQISPTTSLMHALEYPLDSPSGEGGKERAQLLQLLAHETFQTSRGEEQFLPSHHSWNAGVLGLSASAAAYMADVLVLTDAFYAGSESHISEQLAFCLVLQTRSSLRASDQVVYHYWQGREKLAVDALLAAVLTDSFAASPLEKKRTVMRQFTRQLPARIRDYLHAHPEIELRDQAIAALHGQHFKTGYQLAWRYLLKKPGDTQFIRVLLYYTRRGLKRRVSSLQQS
ncbi:hypothetical protein I2I05_02870 [Hymenobacter sp. BT683]|uniref:Nucleotide-diphospho-sugar transferase domain-containing protein n=1 Tax=Hymenobacter jeongseonensis TaxID=2791027 RepID=A0ABS0IE36_9BACT|nr:hypothetical protein [Hymenobacter jeongseonensis]MBF9236329.1 hypothetical protein [Hymenobacter jeongseonensis]